MKAIMMVMVVFALGGCTREMEDWPTNKLDEINTRLEYWCWQAELLPVQFKDCATVFPLRWCDESFAQEGKRIQRRITELQKAKRAELNLWAEHDPADCTLDYLHFNK